LAATPDLGHALAAADAGLNPVASGGGSNVKIPTHPGARPALISTAFGLRGHAAPAPPPVRAGRGDLPPAPRAPPRGWGAGGGPAPGALADFAWGAIGTRLAGSLAARALHGAPAARSAAGSGAAGSGAAGSEPAGGAA